MSINQVDYRYPSQHMIVILDQFSRSKIKRKKPSERDKHHGYPRASIFIRRSTLEQHWIKRAKNKNEKNIDEIQVPPPKSSNWKNNVTEEGGRKRSTGYGGIKRQADVEHEEIANW